MGYCGITQLCLSDAAFPITLCSCSLGLLLWPVEVPRVWVGSAGALPRALSGHHPQASLAPIPGTHSGRAEMLLLGSAAVARALMAAPKAKP